MTVRTYVFRVVVEPDGDAWHAYCPLLVERGAATWGRTREEALRHIQEVLEMVVEELVKDGEELPQGPASEVEVLEGDRVAAPVHVH
jgi:predicted RNase H-like HicB family nuclease